MTTLQLGLDTFGDSPQGADGELVSHAAAIRQVVDEAVLADQVGVDVIALGEHHRPEYSISTPGDRAGRHRHPDRRASGSPPA